MAGHPHGVEKLPSGGRHSVLFGSEVAATPFIFAPPEYLDEQGKPRPMFTIYRDGFMLLVMGYTGKKALAMQQAYIAAFNRMEAALAEKAALPPGRRETCSVLPRRAWETACRRAGVSMRLYDVRHIAVTVMLGEKAQTLPPLPLSLDTSQWPQRALSMPTLRRQDRQERRS